MANQRDPRPDSSVAELALLMPDGVRQTLPMERGEDGLWRYVDTQVLVPGATDVPLSATVDVLEVSRPGESPLAGLVDEEEVGHNPELEWVPASVVVCSPKTEDQRSTRSSGRGGKSMRLSR